MEMRVFVSSLSGQRFSEAAAWWELLKGAVKRL